MADNSTLNSTSGGDTIAADDVTQSGSVAVNAKVQRVKSGFGEDGDYEDPSYVKPLPVGTPAFNVARGLVSGWREYYLSGENPDIDASANFETLWDGGGLYVPPTVTRTHQLASTSTSDTGTSVSNGTATGGSTTTIVDTGATFVSDGVAVGDHVLNDTAGTYGVITAVTGETTLTFANYARSAHTRRKGIAMASSNVYRVVTGGSTGAAWVLVAGLSSASAEQSEFIILNGTTNVPTVSTYPRMNYLRAFSDVGSTATVGTIKATADTDSTVSAQINIGYTQSLMAVHSVPLAASALVLRWWGSLASKTAAMVTFRLLRGKLGHYQHVEQTRTVFSTGMSHFDFKLGPLNLEAGEDIWVNASSDTANTVVSGGFDLIRIND